MQHFFLVYMLKTFATDNPHFYINQILPQLNFKVVIQSIKDSAYMSVYT